MFLVTCTSTLTCFLSVSHSCLYSVFSPCFFICQLLLSYGELVLVYSQNICPLNLSLLNLTLLMDKKHSVHYEDIYFFEKVCSKNIDTPKRKILHMYRLGNVFRSRVTQCTCLSFPNSVSHG